jgi:hypothetical protein
LEDKVAADKHFAIVFAIAGDVEAVSSAHTKVLEDELVAAARRLTDKFGTRYCKLVGLDGVQITGTAGHRKGAGVEECASSSASSPASSSASSPASSSSSSSFCSERQPSKGIMRVAVLHHDVHTAGTFNAPRTNEVGSIDQRDSLGSSSALPPVGCVPVLIVEDEQGSHEALWFDEFFLLELGRGAAAHAPLPPTNRTVEQSIYIPARERTLRELLQ